MQSLNRSFLFTTDQSVNQNVKYQISSKKLKQFTTILCLHSAKENPI